MLILTRRISEVIKIGDDVNLVVLDVKGNQVKIGIDAPKDIAVHREEVYQRIQGNKNTQPSPEEQIASQAASYKKTKSIIHSY